MYEWYYQKASHPLSPIELSKIRDQRLHVFWFNQKNTEVASDCDLERFFLYLKVADGNWPRNDNEALLRLFQIATQSSRSLWGENVTLWDRHRASRPWLRVCLLSSQPLQPLGGHSVNAGWDGDLETCTDLQPWSHLRLGRLSFLRLEEPSICWNLSW